MVAMLPALPGICSHDPGSGGHIGFWRITRNATRCQPGTARDPHLETIWNPHHQKPGGGLFLKVMVRAPVL